MKKNLTITTTERKKKEKKKGDTQTNLLTITSKLFYLAYFTQKILSGYCSDDIYKKGLHPLPPCHMINMKEGVNTSTVVTKE